MQTAKFIHWQDGDKHLGYFVDYPDYWTQGETLDDLKEHLVDLYADLTSGHPQNRRTGHFMKRVDLIGKIEEFGCVLVRHGGKHDWYRNPNTGVSQPVPRHT